MPEPKPAQDGVLRWRASGNARTQQPKLALSCVLAALAAWLCAGGFAGWLDSCAVPAALGCWSAVLLLDLRVLQIRSRRLWLSGTSLVYQSILLGFVGDVSTVTAVRGQRSLSGGLYELVLERRDGPWLRLRVRDWHRHELCALIAALASLRPWIKMDPLVRSYAGIGGRDGRDGRGGRGGRGIVGSAVAWR
ncbi:MAG TPA: hypothetical protein VFA75_05775 [Nevskia sp.]|nr:hypothetical protein [Nevskia sp.]